jgi:hypothetical protein
MKFGNSIIIGAACVVGVGATVYMRAGAPPEVDLTVTPRGLESLKVDKVEFLQSGTFRVEEVLLKDAGGATRPGSVNGTAVWDPERREVTITYPWGIVKADYAIEKGKVSLVITAENTSNVDTIEGIHFTPMVLTFPGKVKEYDGSIPLLAHNLGEIAEVRVSYGTGTLAVVSEDMDKPLMVGFPWSLNKPANTVFPLSVHTNRVGSYPDSYPTIVRPILPRGSDRYLVSLRFGRSGATEASLTGDVNRRFVAAFPQQLHWADRRPIGAIFLASTPDRWPTNPRGWFGDPTVDVTTPAGRAAFKQRLLRFADGAVAIMRDMNAQGAITWDIEGQELHIGTTYIGDPRLVDTLAPEMADAADEYFGRIRAAGLRVGVCVRPQSLRRGPDDKTADQMPVDDPAALLIDKIAYAKKRWGVTLIYLDSNVSGNPPGTMDASVMQRVAAAFPDCLIIPEHSNLRYYAYSAPFAELRHGATSTPQTVREVYPNSFSAIYTADGPLDLYRDALKASVRRGDSLMYRTWFVDPQNEKVKAIYGH